MNFEAEGIFIIDRKSYSVLKNEVETFIQSAKSSLYIRGPVGVGKSYMLYRLAAEYRLKSDYRVTYINDCKKWKLDPFRYLLNELIMTFCDDLIEDKSITEWSKDVVGIEREERMRILFEALIKHVRSNNYQWLFICDQHNALFSPNVIYDRYPFNLIDDLANKNVKVLISASANNEGYLISNENESWKFHNIAHYRYDLDQFKTWCEHYPIKNKVRVDPESNEAVDALFWTGILFLILAPFLTN